ncbi:hypothetical protein TorRG33x02_303100, partial [Trema orientale]
EGKHGAGGNRLGGLLDFDEAHPAIIGNGQVCRVVAIDEDLNTVLWIGKMDPTLPNGIHGRGSGVRSS